MRPPTPQRSYHPVPQKIGGLQPNLMGACFTWCQGCCQPQENQRQKNNKTGSNKHLYQLPDLEGKKSAQKREPGRKKHLPPPVPHLETNPANRFCQRTQPQDAIRKISDLRERHEIRILVCLRGNQGITGLDFSTPAARLCDLCFSCFGGTGSPAKGFFLICSVLLSLRMKLKIGPWGTRR